MNELHHIIYDITLERLTNLFAFFVLFFCQGKIKFSILKAFFFWNGVQSFLEQLNDILGNILLAMLVRHFMKIASMEANWLVYTSRLILDSSSWGMGFSSLQKQLHDICTYWLSSYWLS